jgi:hypothetical protein
MLNLKVWIWSLGTFTTVSYLLCVAWGLTVPEALHMHRFLELILPAFRWLTPAGFFLGLVESFLWGVYAGLVLVPVHNFFYRRFRPGN